MIKIIPDTYSPQLYNSVVKHPLQTWVWGQARQNTGIKILRLGEFQGEKLKKTYLMTLHHIPFTNFNIGYIPRSDLPTKELLEFLKNIAKEYKLIFVKFEPYIEKESTKPLIFTNLNKSPNPLFTNWTIISDLTLDKS